MKYNYTIASHACQVEALARGLYARHREPYECTLWYLALGKRAVLLNLFKQVWVKTIVLLVHDFWMFSMW
jgi:hypothetical protein